MERVTPKGNAKIFSRARVHNAIGDLKAKYVLTMGGVDFDGVKQYFNSDVQIVSVEMNSNTFAIQAEKYGDIPNLKLINGRMTDYLKTTNQKFDVVFLDFWCSMGLLEPIRCIERVLSDIFSFWTNPLHGAFFFRNFPICWEQ